MERKKELLAQIDKVVRTCHKCRLWRTADHAVPGEGNANAQVMFIGEGPGYHEDKLGRPFVGRAGKLLDQLLLKNGLRRADVFITNVVKHRPPDNRAPMKDESRACMIYLLQQIKVINPRVIVPLGRSALEIFLKNTLISESHGIPYKNGSRVIFPLYHPAAGLRSTSIMETLTKDFSNLPKVIRGELELQEVEIENKDKNQLKLI